MPMKDDYRNPFWGDPESRRFRRWPWIVGVVACVTAGSLFIRTL